LAVTGTCSGCSVEASVTWMVRVCRSTPITMAATSVAASTNARSATLHASAAGGADPAAALMLPTPAAPMYAARRLLLPLMEPEPPLKPGFTREVSMAGGFDDPCCWVGRRGWARVVVEIRRACSA
jgi:hypothetical protein